MSENGFTYESVITRVRDKLRCGAERISDERIVFRWSWWPSRPDLQDELLSDYGQATRFSVLEKEFREEIDAIRETLDELAHESELADSQKSSRGAEQSMMKSLNQIAEALSIWDQIGVPIRRRGDIVFRIWAPRDVMGSPIIKALPIDTFINCVAEQSVSDRIEIERVKTSRQRWRITAIMLTVLIGLGAVAWILSQASAKMGTT